MKKIIFSVMLVFALLFNVISVEANENDTYIEAGEYLKDLGLVTGDSSGSLNEDENLTRAESVVIMLRILGKEEEAKNYNFYLSPFSDVPMNKWYAPYIIYAKDNNLVNGVSETEFNPKGKVNSKQLVTMFLRAAGYSADWKKEDIMAKGKAYGLLKGLNQVNNGKADSVRGEAFVIFANAIELPMNPENGEKTCVLAKILKEKENKEALVKKHPKLEKYQEDNYEPDYKFLEDDEIVANVDKKDKDADKDKKDEEKESRIKFVEVKAEPNNPGHNVISLYFTQLMNFGSENLAGVIITDVRGKHSEYEKSWFMDRKNYTVGTTDKKVYIRYTDGAKVVPLDGMTFDIAYEVTMRDEKDKAVGNVTYTFGGSQVVKPDENNDQNEDDKPATINDIIKIKNSWEKNDSIYIKFSENIKSDKAHLKNVYVESVGFTGKGESYVWGENGLNEKSWYTDKNNYTIIVDKNVLEVKYGENELYGKGIKVKVHYEVEKIDSKDKATGSVEGYFGIIIN